tara:strand:+ start:1573 stop:1701 length:129 start_codon:yes stop_codon:yes gene_type:complete
MTNVVFSNTVGGKFQSGNDEKNDNTRRNAVEKKLKTKKKRGK